MPNMPSFPAQALTEQQIIKMTKDLYSRPGAYQTTFMGYKIYIDPALDDMPKFKLSPKMCEILGPFRTAEFHEWSGRFFGVTSEVLVLRGSSIMVVGPKTHRQMMERYVNPFDLKS